MDLLDPSIRRQFVTHIFSILPPRQRDIPRKFLDDFVLKITECELSQDEFPITLEEMSTLLKVKHDDIQKLLDSSYVEGEDYIIESEGKSNTSKPDILLSLETFKDICLRLPGKKASMLRKYFIISDMAYREWFGNAAYYARKHDNPQVTLNKMTTIENYYDGFQRGSLAFVDKFNRDGIEYTQFGHTGNLGIRFPQLQYL